MRLFKTGMLLLALVVCATGDALAEGFALREWSARGVALGGGMVGRADDASAIAYNAAGITQLPGTQIMLGGALIAPQGTIVSREGSGREHSTDTKPATWALPHGYLSYQLNDDIWLGMGVFSRFGLGNSYSENWVGRYSLYDVSFQTISAVPTIAWKINDMFSVSAGVEVLYGTMGMKKKQSIGGPYGDMDVDISGSGWAWGANLGLHARLNERWSVGLAYKSQMTLNMEGESKYGGRFRLPDGAAGATVQLPDSLAFGIAYKPMENLSFELGGMWTRWSTYNALNIYTTAAASINSKQWRDGWNFNASVEYKPLDWWTLRAGFVYEPAGVVNEDHADFFVPVNGRSIASVGMGFAWDNFTLDMAYAHCWFHPISFDSTDAAGYRSAHLTGGESRNVVANIYSISLGYKF